MSVPHSLIYMAIKFPIIARQYVPEENLQIHQTDYAKEAVQILSFNSTTAALNFAQKDSMQIQLTIVWLHLPVMVTHSVRTKQQNA